MLNTHIEALRTSASSLWLWWLNGWEWMGMERIVHQSIYQSMYRSIHQFINQCIDQSINQIGWNKNQPIAAYRVVVVVMYDHNHRPIFDWTNIIIVHVSHRHPVMER